jgi:serine phosphatase RsbU (regulator of sigma subunit)
MVFLFTDGLLENEGPKGETFNMKQLAAALGKAPREASRAHAAVLESARAIWKGAPPKDDVTALTLRWSPQSMTA